MSGREEMLRVMTGIVKTDVHDHTLFRIRMGELESLLSALGYRVIERVVQVREKESVDFVFGKGKVSEIKEKVKKLNPDLFVIYNNITSKQKWNLERALGIEVADRYDVTLMIFKEAASDMLSKLQIELASLEKLFPYVKLSASIKYKRMRAGFRGGGEYAYHKQIRALQKRIRILRDKIERLSRQRELEILKRLESGANIMVLTGYYNAGKTSIFNALTGFEKPVSDKPFTTLSSKYAGVEGERVYLVDTIGFVMDLDPRLIASFKLNLLDIEYSSKQILVIDIADRDDLLKIKLLEDLRILKGLGKGESSFLIAANKADLVRESDLKRKIELVRDLVGEDIPIIPVSAVTGRGLRELVESALKDLEVVR
ncbi:MAG: GTPase [Candidatus Korarchaeum sp.]